LIANPVDKESRCAAVDRQVRESCGHRRGIHVEAHLGRVGIVVEILTVRLVEEIGNRPCGISCASKMDMKIPAYNDEIKDYDYKCISIFQHFIESVKIQHTFRHLFQDGESGAVFYLCSVVRIQEKVGRRKIVDVVVDLLQHLEVPVHHLFVGAENFIGSEVHLFLAFEYRIALVKITICTAYRESRYSYNPNREEQEEEDSKAAIRTRTRHRLHRFHPL